MTTKLTPEQKAEFQRIIDNMSAPVPVLITLEMGAKLLASRARMKAEAGLSQRTLNPRKVRHFARQIREGNFYFDVAETLRISPEGYLLNGQHRLEAQQMVGIAIVMLVQYNVPKEYMLYMDEGSRRTAADALTIRGVANASHMAAAVKLFRRMQKGPAALRNGWRTMTNAEVYALAEEHPGLAEYVALVRQHTATGRGFQHVAEASVIGCALYALETISSKEKVANFSEGFLSGTNLDQRDPRLVCRSALIDLKVKNEHRGQGARLRKFAYVFITWNRWHRKQERVRLSWNPANNFPKPVGKRLWPAEADEKKEVQND